jgi:hypothetical protein
LRIVCETQARKIQRHGGDDRVWAHDLESCRRLGVKPVLRGRRDLVAEWTATIEPAMRAEYSQQRTH